MQLHNIKIVNFKSIYDEVEFDFDTIQGMVKMSGIIGSGKTTLCEAILYGLFGDVKGQTNSQLISWNQKDCRVELNLTSKGKDIHIIRSVHDPLVVELNGHSIAASSKRNAQTILEEELYDTPRLGIEKMCLISFAAFNSIANMNPAQRKEFVDQIFGFHIFTEYNDAVTVERKNQVNERIKLAAMCEEHTRQISDLTAKKEQQKKELGSNINLEELGRDRARYIEAGKSLKESKTKLESERDAKISEITTKVASLTTLGKQQKQYYNTFKSGVCPTCGAPIDASLIDESRKKMEKYATEIKALNATKESIHTEYDPTISEIESNMSDLRKKINDIDTEIRLYNNNVKLVSENYDSLIEETKVKLEESKKLLGECEKEIIDWERMGELFAKTLRYNLLETLIPHINKSIQFFLNHLDQRYSVRFDQEFVAHIHIDGYDDEISYNNLSTGQKKTLDLAIIFGILQNMISNIDFNVVFLDELFSQMDPDSRNLMLSTVRDTFDRKKSIFIINHSDMPEDMFDHKISVSLKNRRLDETRGSEKKVVQASIYTTIY